MRKHVLRLLLLYFLFELMRKVGSELPEIARGQWSLEEFTDRNSLLLMASDLLLFYLYPLFTFLILHRHFRTRKRRTLLLIAVMMIGVIGLRYTVEEVFFPAAFGFRNYYRGVPLSYYLVDNLYFSIFYSLFGVLYFFLQNEHSRKLEHQQLLLENQRTQLSFLRSQVNPHFLFNSLNNIYALIYRQSPKALEAVALLSDQLRYMLYQEQEEVDLQKEWEYIQQYIRLQRLRFEQPLQIEEKVSGAGTGLRVPPLLLIPFVENAFKHGDFRAEGPHIELELAAESGRLRFRISNTKGPREKDAAGGIGLQNLRQRLELLFPGRHSLLTVDTGNRFTAELEVHHAG